MSILSDFFPLALGKAVKNNLHDFFRSLSRLAQTEALDEPGLARWHTRVPYPWFNGMLASRPATGSDMDTVRAATAWFQARQVASFTWWLAPGSEGAGWEEILRAQGLRLTQGPPGMAVDLGALDAEEPLLPGFHISPVTDESALRAWARTFTIGYELPPEWEAPLLEMAAALGLDLPLRNYLGCLDGRPVATSNLFLGAGVAGVYDVATLPAARGQGFGRAMTLAPLVEARQMGYRIGVLQASEMGFPVYRRMGFQQVCRVDHFYWEAG
jgi:ribosomal protein S18 acetylase RimI-like enzyme